MTRHYTRSVAANGSPRKHVVLQGSPARTAPGGDVTDLLADKKKNSLRF